MSTPEQLALALETARNGLLWYQDRYPKEVNGCDDEAMAEIDEALSAYHATPQPTTTKLSGLPPLPKTKYLLGIEGDGYSDDRLTRDPGYSDDDMHAYVITDRQARSAEREAVAVVGRDYQLLWCRQDWSKGIKVGDYLYVKERT